MNDIVIDSERLQALLKDFQLLTNMRISFWRPDGQKILTSSSDINSQFCTELQKKPALQQACNNCDTEALKIARETKKLYTFICHAGLEESVYPLVYHDRLLGYLMIGQARSEDLSPSMLQSFWQHLERHGLKLDELGNLYMRLPYITHEKRTAAIHMLRALTGYVYLENLVKLDEGPLIRQIDEYIDEHIGEPLRLGGLSERLKIDKATIRQTLRRERAATFAGYVRTMRARRMQKAMEEGRTASQAAREAGFACAAYGRLVYQKQIGTLPKNRRSDPGEDG